MGNLVKNKMHNLPELSVEITSSCPMKCKHCSSSAGEETKNVLTVEEIKDLIQTSKDNLGTYSFSLSGGDPLVKDGWDGKTDITKSSVFELMMFAKQNNMQILLYTSGNTRFEKQIEYECRNCGFQSTLNLGENDIPYCEDCVENSCQETTDIEISLKKEHIVGLSYEQIQILAESFGMKRELISKPNGELVPVFKIIFSLHGPKKVHDEQMGIEGSFDELMRVIRDCKKEEIYISLHCVPSGHNYNELLNTIDIAAEAGADEIAFLRFVPQGRGLENISMFKWGQMEFLIANRQLLFATLFRKDIKIRIGEPMDFLFLLNEEMQKKVCDGGMGKILIRPDGDAHVCPAWKELPEWKAGNIRQTSLIEIWENASTYKKFRKYYEQLVPLIEKCKACEYIIKCKGGCTAQRILECKDMYGAPDPLCFVDLIEKLNERWENLDYRMKFSGIEVAESFVNYLKYEDKKHTKYDFEKLDTYLREIRKFRINPLRFGLPT